MAKVVPTTRAGAYELLRLAHYDMERGETDWQAMAVGSVVKFLRT